MAYPPEISDEAFNLFRKCNSVYSVASELGVHPGTIMSWRVKYDWDDKINKIRQIVMGREAERALTDEEKTLEDQKRVIEQYAKDDEDNLKILKAFKAICVDEINRHKANKAETKLEIRSLKDATDVMNNVIKLERLIKGDPTEYTHHTISPMAAYSHDKAGNAEIIRALREEIDDIKCGRLIEQ